MMMTYSSFNYEPNRNVLTVDFLRSMEKIEEEILEKVVNERLEHRLVVPYEYLREVLSFSDDKIHLEGYMLEQIMEISFEDKDVFMTYKMKFA